MAWWTWILLGFALILLELATPGAFYFLFFGASALLVGVLVGFGISTSQWLDWLLFSVFAVGAIAFLRPTLLRRFGPSMDGPTVDSLIGEIATALERIQGNGGIGKVEMRGSTWNACNTGDHVLTRGERCRVERVEGLMLYVRQLGSAAHTN
jgi:membrane protein implicated in regulation of membrane protease activity